MTGSCTNCGAEIPEGAQVCDNCGMPVSAAGSPREEPPPRPPTTPPPVPQDTPAREAPPPEVAQGPLREPESSAPPRPPPVPTEERRRVSTPRRRTPLVLGAVLLVLLGVGVAGWFLVMGEEEQTAGSGFSVVEDGALRAEFPSDWGTATGTDSEAGQLSWSSFLGGDVGASVTAAPDLEGWGASVTVGSYVVASKALADGYTNNDLVVMGPNDMSGACTREGARDYERGSFQVRVQTWSRCDNEPSLNFYTVAAAPEDRECVVVMKLGGFGEAERRLGQNVIDTFEVDCGALPA